MALKGDTTGLDVLTFGGAPMVPLNDGFSRVRNSGVIQSRVNAGASRVRKKYHGGVHVCDVSFYLETPAHQDFFELFINRNEGKRFIMWLAADRPIVEPYVVQMVSDPQYSSVTAVDATVTFTIEVFTARDKELDDWLAAMYPLLGSEIYDVLLGFKPIVEAMPKP